ncbi:hypothetical protein H8356DRAFT_1342602 [Neocallimastix lanati (nom. inval.)]|nr:hypothetical protein H8356DRAFT_1342602 [Neocallimastix sp. JGI-2020a]
MTDIRNIKSEKLVTYATVLKKKLKDLTEEDKEKKLKNELEDNDNDENNRNEEEFFYKESILLEIFLDFDLFLNNIRKADELIKKKIEIQDTSKFITTIPCQKNNKEEVNKKKKNIIGVLTFRDEEKKIRDMGYKDIYGNNS